MLKIILFVFASILPVVAVGDIYKYTDNDGRVYYNLAPKNSLWKRVIKSRAFRPLKPPSYKAITQNQKNTIEKYIKNRLSDPYTAHFKWSKDTSVTFNEDERKTISYCAFVNYKNKFGGYVGYTPYKTTLIESKKGWEVDDLELGDDVYCRATDD